MTVSMRNVSWENAHVSSPIITMENSAVEMDTVIFQANHASTLIALKKSTLHLTELNMIFHSDSSPKGLVYLEDSQFHIHRLNATLNVLSSGSMLRLNHSSGTVEESSFGDNWSDTGTSIRMSRSMLTVLRSNVRGHECHGLAFH